MNVDDKLSSSKSKVDANENVIQIDLSGVSGGDEKREQLIVEPKDNWIGKFLYGGPIGLAVDFTALIAITVYFALTVNDKLEDKWFSENVVQKVWWPSFSQFWIYIVPLDAVMNALLVLLLYPLSRVSRSQPYYWFLGCSFSILMLVCICIPMNHINLLIRCVAMLNCSRLSMKAGAFLIECNASEDTFKKSSMKTLLYYLFIPHFVYKVEYPRTERIRWLKVLSHVWWVAVGILVVAPFLMQLAYSVQLDLMKVDLFTVILMSAAVVISMLLGYAVLVWFFLFNHFCGFYGELLRFPDQKFFGAPVGIFKGTESTTKLNTIVSRWLSSYIYIPVVKRSDSRLQALCWTMFVSMLYHEIGILYILDFLIIPLSLAALTLPPLALYIQWKGKFVNALVSAGFGLALMTYGINVALEFIAWNYSSMPNIEERSRFRIVPLFWFQLYENFFGHPLELPFIK